MLSANIGEEAGFDVFVVRTNVRRLRASTAILPFNNPYQRTIVKEPLADNCNDSLTFSMSTLNSKPSFIRMILYAANIVSTLFWIYFDFWYIRSFAYTFKDFSVPF
ncbi:hypothetical protein AB4K20DRAFT_1863518 [Rhizopus microsporus]